MLDNHPHPARELEILRQEGDPHEPDIVVAALPGPLDRAGYPYPLPAVGAPLRVAFVGSRPEFDACVLHAPAGGLAPTFIDHRREGDLRELRAALAAAAPHVVVVFDAAGVPAGLMDGLRATTLGVVDGHERRLVSRYDRLVSSTAADALEVWRTFPLPVDDRIYAPVDARARPPRALFVGASTAYRERFLVAAKHEHDLLHYAHGLWGAALREACARCDVAVNVHRDGQPAFEHRVLVHLAAGQLLLSEPLLPAYGLEPEIDFIPIVRPDELVIVLDQLRGDRPDLHERVRQSGRLKADEHRASRVWPRVLGDLLDDVAAFGTHLSVTAPPQSVARGG
jgi:hypothetical protein